MRLTSKTAYGVQALFDLAFHADGRATQAREIAERRGIPLRYLEQLLGDLRRAGLVEAKRGPRGGYALGRSVNSIRLIDVVVALEGDVSAVSAVESPDDPSDGRRRRSARTPVAGVDVPGLFFRELASQVSALYAGITLGDMVARAESLGLSRAVPEPQMYFI